MELEIEVGISGTAEEAVTEDNTARAVGSGTLPVYATPAMTALMEMAAARLLEEYVPEDWTTVGISLNIQHKAATPVGKTICAEAKVTAVDGRKVTLEVRAHDGTEEIGCGTHERFAVACEKFLAKTQQKMQG